VTFSIAARDPRNGMLGVAASSKALATGSAVPYVRKGAGAIASQSFVNPYLGIDGLVLLEQGLPAERAVEHLIEGDPGRELRQLGIVDVNGRTAAYTGERCIPWAGHVLGGGYVCLGNILVGERVVQAMAKEFERTVDEELPERLLQALEAGQAVGGDRRGRQSAGIYVIAGEEYPWCDLRVDDHEDPVPELRRVFELWKRDQPFWQMMLPRRDDLIPAWDAVRRVRDAMEQALEEAQAVKES
jgi:uncharacterized Ntn-hydrolase superfamily protein